MQKNFIRAFMMGVLASFFFAFNFILIRSMNLGGGYFLWTACLRYLFTLPLIALVLIRKDGFAPVFSSIRKDPAKWLLWSTVGFGLFYAPLSAASVYGESWFTASIWQFTIVAGVLLTPLFGKKIPGRSLACSFVIVSGILLMQYSRIRLGVKADWPMLILTMGIATFSYPLGNRKTMQLTAGDGLTTPQRIFGMTLCSIPFWAVCSIVSFAKAGLPAPSQCLQAFLVALLAGVIATILFFHATDMVRDDPRQLAVVEATQSGEVIFTAIMGILILKDSMPDAFALVGIVIIIAGMIAGSLLT
ncbi:DMT family transporter [Chordicoccus furentiruminis]|uniref:DMT family transporter n=1 Tax=Chordicoccus furentiruminis TaxID=2709410 RepID=UPI0023A860B2|nr:multidrug resistance efflux transporter family protein [Chordicoccus furentiruminis]